MSKNYLIGIGGTGARVIEAAINLCAAGLGPDELSIFIVDPDAGNGNLTRTKNLIANYKKCRANLQKTEDTKIFRTDIKIPPDEKGLVWEIFSDRGVTLSNFINLKNMMQTQPDLADLASVLFTETELNTQLNEGFRGHPSIGSVVMSAPPYETYPFKMLMDDLADKKPNDVRVFLAGSVFGGTGAAGFPTLGSKQIIKFHPSAKTGDGQSKVLLGGALVLPYFSFELENDTTEKMFVTTNDFPIATKAALQYYNEKDLGFDQIYFIGDSLGQKVGKFGVGSGKQENLPHYIEIVSSLAAFDFFSAPESKDATEKMLFTSCREHKTLNWNSLPVSRDATKIRAEQLNVKTLMTRMTVFAYAYTSFGKKILETNHHEIKDAWYLDYFRFNNKDEKEKVKDPRQHPNKNVLDDFQIFMTNFLFWITSMDGDSVELIDKNMLIDGELEIGKAPVFFNPENETTLSNIGHLVKNEKTKGADFNAFKKAGLNAVELKDKRITEASSKFIHIFYEGAAKYSRLNYNIN